MTDKILIDRDVVEQALEALERNTIRMPVHLDYHFEAIKALRAALEQPQFEQDPIAVVTGFYGGFPTIRPLEPTVLPYGMALYAHPQPPRQPQVEQEPVAWRWLDDDPVPGTRPKWEYYDKDDFAEGVNPTEYFQLECLYTHPQPPRQPLTDQQIHDCFQHRHRDKATERRMITRAIEFAHGITGEQE